MSAIRLQEVGALAAALAVADRHGLFEALEQGPRTAEDLARALELDPTATARVLEVMRTQNILTLDASGYALTDATRLELSGPLGPRGRSVAFWSQAPEWTRSGTQPRRPVLEEAAYSGLVDSLARMFQPAVEVFAPVLAEVLSGVAEPELLDVGAGSGGWSLGVLERLDGGRVTALDRPRVLDRFSEAAARGGLTERTETWPADYHTIEPDRGPFDAVILANVLHLERPEPARALVERVARLRRASGCLVVIDMFSDGSFEQERARAAYAMNLAMRIEGGFPHAEVDVRAWLGDAGLSSIRRIVLGGAGLAALVAERPRG